MEIDGVTVETGYQLSVEDAVRVAEHDVVVFADADAKGPAPFSFDRVDPRPPSGFSTHSVSPGAVLAMAREHFAAGAEGYLLAVRGREFDGFEERLSGTARGNLDRALAFIEPVLRERRFAGACSKG
jgi:Ni,Fe-hydrogenase maturation factor